MPRSPDRPPWCPTCHWPGVGLQPINHCPLSPTYFTCLSTHPDHNLSIQEYSGMQFRKPCKLKANDIHGFSFVHKTSHFIAEGTQVVWARLSFGISVLMIPDHLLLHHAPRNVCEEGLLYDLPRNRIPAQEQNSCPRTFWVLHFPWTSAVPLLNAFPSTFRFNGSVKSNKSLPRIF